MEKPKDKPTAIQMQPQPGSVLEELAREGAWQMLARALEAEVTEFASRHESSGIEGGINVSKGTYDAQKGHV